MKLTIEISPEEFLTLTGGGDVIKQATEKALEEFREQCMISPTGFHKWFNHFPRYGDKDGIKKT